MSTYAFRDAAGDLVASFPEFARPIPVHAQTPGAIAAVESSRAHGRKARLDRAVAELVTDHGNAPPPAPYDGDVVTPAARRLAQLAAMQGFEIIVGKAPDRAIVSGYRKTDRAGFSATWARGKAAGAAWHEPRLRFALVDDPRPEPAVSKLTRTSLAKRRPVGVPKIHLRIAASPHGVPVSMAELNERIKA